MQPILVTGSEGLIGRRLRARLHHAGIATRGLDLRGQGADAADVRDHAAVRARLQGCGGVIHLAAVSRVVWAEQDPDACWATNVGGLNNVIDVAAAMPRPPWFIFGSSREVYGCADQRPTPESAPLRPVNVYGRSKLAGEQLIQQAHERGLRACTVRFSNVYGRVDDHADRVIPAFVAAALGGASLRVDSAAAEFDFTHVRDIVEGLFRLVQRAGDLPAHPLHFVSGHATSLLALARLVLELSGSRSSIMAGAPRQFDVSRFVGCPKATEQVLGWRHSTALRDGLRDLVEDWRAHHGMTPTGAEMNLS